MSHVALRVFVCSPLRGPDGQPSEANRELARMLMRAVFDAGHCPFVPHLLYPQVLTESEADLKVAFRANFKFLYACDEMWIYAERLEECSKGMRLEVEDVQASCALRPNLRWPTIRWMPTPFRAVKTAFDSTFSQKTGHLGVCTKCGSMNTLNTQEICLRCFSGTAT